MPSNFTGVRDAGAGLALGVLREEGERVLPGVGAHEALGTLAAGGDHRLAEHLAQLVPLVHRHLAGLYAVRLR
jgi:hypothetical protein